MQAEIVICADDDRWTEGNPGLTKAKAAADAYGVRLISPKFKDLSSKPTDFNDLHVLKGIEAVKTQLEKAGRPSYFTLETIYTKQIETNPIVDGVFDEGDPLVLYSPGGVGKSALTLNLALHLAAGTHTTPLWGKFNTPKPRRTVFVQSENSLKATHERVVKMCRGNPEFQTGLSNVFFPNNNDAITWSGFFDDPKFQQEVIRLIKGIEDAESEKIDLMVVDPLISYHSQDENDNSRMRSTLDAISAVSNELKVTPVVVHHANKDGGLRGASAIIDWARSVVKLQTTYVDKRRCVQLIHEKANNCEMFEPFTLQVDQYLNFYQVEQNIFNPKMRERGEKVAQALRDIGGFTDLQKELIEQYMELGMCPETTAKRHIADAINNGFIRRDLNRNETDAKRKYVYRMP